MHCLAALRRGTANVPSSRIDWMKRVAKGARKDPNLVCCWRCKSGLLLPRSVILPSHMHGALRWAVAPCTTRLSDFPVRENGERLSVRLQPLIRPLLAFQNLLVGSFTNHSSLIWQGCTTQDRNFESSLVVFSRVERSDLFSHSSALTGDLSHFLITHRQMHDMHHAESFTEHQGVENDSAKHPLPVLPEP